MTGKPETEIIVRLGAEEVTQLDRLAAQFHGVVSKADVARAAIRLGLTVLEHDPTLLDRAAAGPDAAATEAAGASLDTETEQPIAERVVELHGTTLDRLAK